MPDETEEIFKKFEEESDAFFDSLLSDAGVGGADSPSAAKKDSEPATATDGSKEKGEETPTKPSSAATVVAEQQLPPSDAAPTAEQGAHAAVGSTARPQAESAGDDEFMQLTQRLQHGGSSPSRAPAPPSTPPAAAAGSRAAGTTLSPGSPVAVFAMDEGDADGDADTRHSTAESVPVTDLRPPDAPPAPPDFTAEDLALRRTLTDFYIQHNPANVVNVNLIVAKYRGATLPHLWATLAIKYTLPAHEAIDLLARSLYSSTTLFEYTDQAKAATLEKKLASLKAEVLAKQSDSPGGSSAAKAALPLFTAAMERCAEDGSDDLLRALCFRGVPEDGSGVSRAKAWKVLLGYLPVARQSEWAAIAGEKRALYAGYRRDFLDATEEKIKIREAADGRAACGAPLTECQDLLEEARNDVNRTRRDFEFFRRANVQSSLLAMLYVFGRLNPGVRYVQGMNEIAALVLYVMWADGDAESAEADAFWCFTGVMAEIKEGFMQAMDDTHEGAQAMANSVTWLLATYDRDLATHLNDSDLPPFVWAFRWVTLLFAQDATLPDVLRLWDSFLSDPRRFEFVYHVAVAAVLSHRREIIETERQFVLAELLQSAARNADFDLLLRRAFAICCFQRREQTPPFPPKSDLDELADFANAAAAKARQVQAELSKTFEENIAPAVQEHASEVRRSIQENLPIMQERAAAAAQVAAVAGQEGAQAVQAWLQDTAPAREEALKKAQSQLTSLWDSVRSSGASAVTRGQSGGAGESSSQQDGLDEATKRLQGAADSAASAASLLAGRAASFWASTTTTAREAAQQQAAAPSTASASAGSSGGYNAAPPAKAAAQKPGVDMESVKEWE
eukprot:TRINITY_DN39315_c0_g1_i1.p1 TRINITY_DN39315_c0_g1~~TRINITY_DN39315_c0_g1_i1.p1  ORF type:complete len:848 (-),score=264.89 TRINITY_DN39315_c0_g1_i1:65-2608(-)